MVVGRITYRIARTVVSRCQSSLILRARPENRASIPIFRNHFCSLRRSQNQFQVVGRDEEVPRDLGPNLTMKSGDWICPKCSFMNFARNTKCLECEEARPQRQLTGGEWDCPRCNFFNYRRNAVCLKCECRRPSEASLPGSPGHEKVPSERQLVSSHNRNNYDDNRIAGGNHFRVTNQNLETSVDHTNQFRANTSSFSSSGSGSYSNSQNDRNARPPFATGSHSDYVPFVPLPADMFAKKPEKITNEHGEEAVVSTSDSVRAQEDSQCSEQSATYVQSRHTQHTKKITNEHSGVVSTSDPVRAGEDSQFSETPATYVQSRYTQDIDKEQTTERWFKKVKELHGVTDPTSANDFPRIMPIRKGENRSVDSDMKSKHEQAMENGTSSSFVPFPSNHFAKKDNQQLSTSTNSTRDLDSRSSIGVSNTGSSSTQFSENTKIGQQTPGKLNERSGWTGKSLEGSAVTETDPLDMSEEAKAERWFRRVAQIKDISELSQIPDEDFPSIMPMRKGVNRFVVSKRKTPLERRLTSPEYRKNLRIMSSDPMKREGGDDEN